MINFFIKTSVLFFILITVSKVSAESPELTLDQATKQPEFSFETKELYIPTVVVDGNLTYKVKMIQTNSSDGMVFSLSEATELPSFEARFATIESGMSRQQVLAILGIPGQIYNLKKNTDMIQHCPEPLLDEEGATFEQWNYFIEPVQVPSGFVVWFAETEPKKAWKVVGITDNFTCM